MNESGYKDRQNLEILVWPELMQTFPKLVEQVMISPTNKSSRCSPSSVWLAGTIIGMIPSQP